MKINTKGGFRAAYYKSDQRQQPVWSWIWNTSKTTRSKTMLPRTLPTFLSKLNLELKLGINQSSSVRSLS